MRLQFVEGGEIVNVHGLKGEIKVLPWVDSPEDLVEFDRCRIARKDYEIELGRVQKTCDLVKLKGIDMAQPLFVRYCRVGAGDAVGDITGCELVCMLVGERPGLVTDKSMSAYLTYKPHTGVSESARTVISNIHAQGTPAVEAGAAVAELIDLILRRKVSGVGLVAEAGA